MTEHIYTKTEKNLVLIASCVAIFITPAMGTMVNLALVSIGKDFNIGTHNLGWLTTMFFMASVIFLIPAARASNLYGKKRMFIVGLIITLIGNLASSLSPDYYILCFTRIVTGMGAAFISCTGVSMLSAVFKPNERGRALGINTASVYLGASLGPVIGGFLTDILGWRSIFYIIIPFVAVALATIIKVNLPESLDNSGRFDYTGAIIYAIAVSLTIFGLINLPDLWAFGMIVAGIVLTALFFYIQKREEQPLLRVSIFKNSRFSRSIVAVLLNYSASYSVTFFLSLYLQSIGQLSATNASLVLLAQPIVQTIITPSAGRLSDHIDKRFLPTVGMAIVGIGLVMLLFVGVECNLLLIVVSLLVLGFGFSLFSAPNTNAIMSYVRADQYNDASAMISTMRQTGMMLSLGIAMCIISVVMGSADVITPDTYDSFVEVMRVAWVVFIGFSVVGTFISWFRGKAVDSDY